MTLEALAIPDSMLTALMTRLAGVCGVHIPLSVRISSNGPIR